jgi:hypothetical protein
MAWSTQRAKRAIKCGETTFDGTRNTSNLWRKLCTKLNEKGGGLVPEKTIKRRLEELECQLAAADGPIFSTVAKLVRAPICVCRGSQKKFREEISESAPVILCSRLTAIKKALLPNDAPMCDCGASGW